MSDRKIGFLLFSFVLAIYLLTASLRIDSGDGATMYRVACSLANGQGFAIPVEPRQGASFGAWGKAEPLALFEGGDGYGIFGSDGRYYAKYGPGWSLLAAPLCAVAGPISNFIPGLAEGYLTRIAVMLLNPLLSAWAVCLLFMLARRFYSTSRALTLSFLFAFGTIFWYYAKSAFSEPLVTLLLLGAIYAIEIEKPVWAGAALGGTLLTRQTAILLVIPVVIWALWRWRQQGWKAVFTHASALLLPLALGQTLMWGYNFYRFRDPLEYGYHTIGWDSPFWLGLYGLLISPGKGLLVFSPLILLGIAGWPAFRRRDLVWLCLSLCLAYLVFHAGFRYWDGGGGWGPRLLLPIVPMALLPAGEVLWKWQDRHWVQVGMALIIAASIVVQVLGISINWVRHLQRVLDDSASSQEYFYRVNFRWADSPILGQVQSLKESVSLMRHPDSRETLASLVSPKNQSSLTDWQSESVGLLSLNLPDFWFIYFGYLGVPGFMILAILLVLGGVALATGVRLLQIIQAPDLESQVATFARPARGVRI